MTMVQRLEPRTTRNIRPGIHYPLGATVQDGGVNFALYSQDATSVFLLLFDRPDGEPTDIIGLRQGARRVWHAFVEGLRPGQLYGFKVRGPFEPRQGLRFNEHKLVMDPYAKALAGKFRNASNLLLAYDATSADADLSLDTRDNTRIVPKSVVISDHFEWQGDAPPHIAFEDLVLYETHVRGFTAHPSSRVRSPGTYLGLVEKIGHLKDLGVNGVVLLPVQEFCVEDYLIEKGLTNYWGYNPIGFFAPEASFSSHALAGSQVAEFKTMVRELHKAGIEVLLDLSFRHTAEGSELGPTMCFRGIDNRTYYCLEGGPYEPRRFYASASGSGNCLNITHPHVTRFVMDVLRYWVDVMHADGFRIDLVSLIGADGCGFASDSPLLHAIAQDPVLSRTKFVCEPWDRRRSSSQRFPIDWAEANVRFRDTVRRFIRGDDWQLGDLAYRMTGSGDLYGDDGRSAFVGVNFITSHNGYTLHDLVSYAERRNEANLEENLDGPGDELSVSCGVDGETRDPEVNRLRGRLARNYVCHLMLALGTPMLLGGDEFLRSQLGNNNAYCQDNEISWFDWDLVRRRGDFLAFVKKAIAFRSSQPSLRVRRAPAANGSDGVAQWFDCSLGEPDWHSAGAHTLALHLHGGQTERGQAAPLFVIFNAAPEQCNVRIVEPPGGMSWHRVVDTSLPAPADFAEPGGEVLLEPQDAYLANPRCTVVLLAR